jgi:hypothetical protein
MARRFQRARRGAVSNLATSRCVARPVKTRIRARASMGIREFVTAHVGEPRLATPDSSIVRRLPFVQRAESIVQRLGTELILAVG